MLRHVLAARCMLRAIPLGAPAVPGLQHLPQNVQQRLLVMRPPERRPEATAEVLGIIRQVGKPLEQDRRQCLPWTQAAGGQKLADPAGILARDKTLGSRHADEAVPA
jgi:hypothetical protein